MAVRIGHEREDFRGRRPYKHLASYPARARLDLDYRISHAPDCNSRPSRANWWASRVRWQAPPPMTVMGALPGQSCTQARGRNGHAARLPTMVD